jgi:hypothetical protein
MSDPIKYFDYNRFLVPEKLLVFLHSQLKLKAYSYCKYKSLDGINNYLDFYFSNEFLEKYPSLYHLFNSLGMGISSSNIERAIKGKKGRKKANVDFEVSYILLDFLCYAAWNKSLIANISDSDFDWGDSTLYSVVLPEYIQDDSFIKNKSKTSRKNNLNPEIKQFANKIYIELITRKAAIPFDEKNDVIEEIYNSWYKLFCTIRDEMKLLTAECLKEKDNPDSIIGIAFRIMNDILRPHLTEHQAKFRGWIEKERKKTASKNASPQELQKKYPDYKILVNSIIEVNRKLIKTAEMLIR